MIAPQRSALPALAAAVALVVAACGSTPGPVPAPPAPPANPPANPTTPQENSSFPYHPSGVTFNGGGAGGLLTFSIPGGTYGLNVHASYDPANDPYDSGQCLFSGELDYLSGSGSTDPLGGNAPITSFVPFAPGPFEGSYGAGDYKIYIYPQTTCSWTVQLLP